MRRLLRAAAVALGGLLLQPTTDNCPGTSGVVCVREGEPFQLPIPSVLPFTTYIEDWDAITPISSDDQWFVFCAEKDVVRFPGEFREVTFRTVDSGFVRHLIWITDVGSWIPPSC